ncbi:MAG: hypothetical protein M1832_002863 [Thelocarpon impressellum]|nr:MAG: hypothetical protein M1832_002863 [Thelocarpon impressellum]
MPTPQLSGRLLSRPRADKMADGSPDVGIDDLQLSDTAMLVDPDDLDVVEEQPDGDVAIVGPDQLDQDDGPAPEPEPALLADNHEAMKAKLFQDSGDLEIETEAVSTWKIEGWRHLKKKEHGPIFECGGHPWRVLFFPYGNSVEFASFYLEQAHEDKAPEDWYACVQFALVLWNPKDPSIYASHTATHRFTADEGDWGFTRYAELRKLFGTRWEGRERPLVEDDGANMTAYLRIVKDPTGVLWHNFLNYDSKKETGYVGLRNQGATCYLNSLLQSLYFTNAFRKVGLPFPRALGGPLADPAQAVYQIPTQSEDTLTNSAYTLQRLFYLLQSSNDAVPTAELTRSFGWETKQIFEQQDVQELSRILMERLEEKMKGTEAENALAKLFVGKTKTYVSCIDVDYESSRIEDFWDVQLNVSGNKDLDDSFRDYVQVETMDGENKYFAEGHGLQDARKGVIFESFPQVLHLQLKRFEYDINRDAMMKVNDRYEFPETFDASPYLSDEADRSEPYVYRLHGVLVHSGDFNAGHYYAFLKPTKDGHFYKFDDDRVTRATLKEAIEDNFGGEYGAANGAAGMRNPYTRTLSTKRSMSAYMLVYIRQSRLDSVLLDLAPEDTPSHLQRKLDEERETRRLQRQAREEEHLYLSVGVITDDIFRQYQGLDLADWEAEPDQDPAAPRPYRILRTTTVGQFTRRVAEDLGRDPAHARLWVMVNRQNKTTRPDQPLMDVEATVDEAYVKNGTKNTGFRVWVELADRVEAGRALWPDMQPQTTKNAPVLLFLKCFDAEAQTLKGAGHIYIRKHDKVCELAPPILQLMGWPADTTLKLHEEIKPSMIEPMKSNQTLNQAEIQDGDVVCFQKTLSDKENEAIRAAGGYADARDFYDYLCNRLTVRFTPRWSQDREGDSFELALSKKMLYDQFAAKVGERVRAPATHIRFFTVNATTGNAKTTVKPNPNTTLQHVLTPQYTYGGASQLPNALFYEVLDLSLSELETKKNLKITWLSEGITKEETFDILVAKNGVMADVLPMLKRKAGLDDGTAPHIRVYEVHTAKVYKELGESYGVAGINEFVSLYAERVPEEEEDAAEDDRAIFAFHFNKEPSKAHGVPFKFLVKPVGPLHGLPTSLTDQGEVFKETRSRLEKRTGIKGKQFEKIKFAVVQRISYSKPIYLNDDDILSDVATDGEDLLGLDHVDRSRGPVAGRGDGVFIR